MHAESDEREDATLSTATEATPGPLPEASRGATAGPVPADSHRELGSRAPDFIKASGALHLTWKIGVFIVGLAVVGGGVLLLPLPGPGWLVIFGGMAIWATEFVWAQLVLRWTRRKVAEAAHKALDPRVRRRNIILTVIAVLIIAGLVVVYIWQFGAVTPWNIRR